MTVAELIEDLKKYPQDYKIGRYCAYGDHETMGDLAEGLLKTVQRTEHTVSGVVTIV